MSKTINKLAPVVVRGAKAAATQVQQDGRKRGILAINEEGKLVVCCRRTAKKNGWAVQEALYERSKSVKAEEPAKKAPQRRAADKAGMVSKDKVKAAKEVVDSTLDEILGK